MFSRYNSNLSKLPDGEDNWDAQTYVVNDINRIPDDGDEVPDVYLRDEPKVIVDQIHHIQSATEEHKTIRDQRLYKTLRTLAIGSATLFVLVVAGCVVAYMESKRRLKMPQVLLEMDAVLDLPEIVDAPLIFDALFTKLVTPGAPQQLTPLMPDAVLRESHSRDRHVPRMPLDTFPFPRADLYADARAANATDPSAETAISVAEAIMIIDAFCDYLKQSAVPLADQQVLAHFERAADSEHSEAVRALLRDPTAPLSPVYPAGPLAMLSVQQQHNLHGLFPQLASDAPRSLSEILFSSMGTRGLGEARTPAEVVQVARKPFLDAAAAAKEQGMTWVARISNYRLLCAAAVGSPDSRRALTKAELRLVTAATHLGYLANVKTALLRAASHVVDDDEGFNAHLNRAGRCPAPAAMTGSWEQDTLRSWEQAVQDAQGSSTQLELSAE